MLTIARCPAGRLARSFTVWLRIRAASPEGGERPPGRRGSAEAVPCRPPPALADARFAPWLRPARAGVLGAALQRSLELQHELVNVAPAPIIAGFERGYNGMLRRVEVPG